MSRETFTLFWNGPFSQWHPCSFTLGGARDRAQWQGLNLLGETLTRVHEAIAWERTRAGLLP